MTNQAESQPAPHTIRNQIVTLQGVAFRAVGSIARGFRRNDLMRETRQRREVFGVHAPTALALVVQILTPWYVSNVEQVRHAMGVLCAAAKIKVSVTARDHRGGPFPAPIWQDDVLFSKPI